VPERDSEFNQTKIADPQCGRKRGGSPKRIRDNTAAEAVARTPMQARAVQRKQPT
jgi:hypothetical protein